MWAVILGASALGVATVYEEGVIALVVPVLVGVLALIVLVGRLAREPETRSHLLRWTLGAMAAHLLFGLLVQSSPAVTGYLGPDAGPYHSDAVDIVRHWTEGTAMPVLPSGKEGFYYLLAGLYWVFGAYTWLVVAVNAALAAALVPVVSDTTRRLLGGEAARYVPPLVVLLPGLFIWTSMPLREASILLLIAVAANLGVRLLDGFSAIRVVGLAVTSTALFTFRNYVALAVVGGLVCGIAFGKRHLPSGIAAAIVTVILVAVVMSTSGLGSRGYQAGVNANLQLAGDARLDLAAAPSGFAADVDISSPRQALEYMPVGVTAFVLGPFPWQISGIRQLPGLIDALVWWLLLPSLWRGYRAGWRLAGRRLLVIVIPALSATALMALVVANFGTVLRQRSQLIILVVPLIAFGLAQRLSARRSVRELTPVGLAPRAAHDLVVPERD